MPSFSERHGFIAAKMIQLGSMDQALRTSLWNFIDAHFFESNEHYLYEDAALQKFAQILYDRFHKDRFHKKVVRSLPGEVDEFIEKESKWFEKAPWNSIYDYCEFCLEQANKHPADVEKYWNTELGVGKRKIWIPAHGEHNHANY